MEDIIYRSCNSSPFPTPDMSRGEVLSSFLSLILLISIVLYFIIPLTNQWLYFLCSSLVLYGILWCFIPESEYKTYSPSIDTYVDMRKTKVENEKKVSENIETTDYSESS